jgi:phosphoserine phosphatase RsbU/P
MAKTQQQIERDEQIYQLSTLAAGEFSLQQVLDKLAEAAVRIVGVKACSIRLLDEAAGDLKMRSTYGLSSQYHNKGVVSKEDPVIKAAFAGKAVVLDDMRIDDRVKYKEATIAEGLVSQLTVSMNFKGKPIGVLRLYSPTPMRFDRSDISIARAVASQCAVAVTNARLYAKALEGAKIAEQMKMAGYIQRKMIPEHAPKMPNLDIAATYIPCYAVGGDFYDFLRLDDDRLAIGIADVMGKGMPAALMMSCFRSAVRAYAEFGMEDIGTVIRKLNRMACSECNDGEFISFFYAIIDTKQGTITYCNCGHEPTVLIRDGQCIDLDKGGMVLGVDVKAEYENQTIILNDKDSLLFFTDGLTDAANFNGDLWGRDNLLAVAKKFALCPAEQMAGNILLYRRRFVGLADQLDDISVVVVRFLKDRGKI